MKRVSKHQALNLFGYLLALDTKGRQLLRQAWQDDAGSLSAQDRDSLLRQRLEDLCGRVGSFLLPKVAVGTPAISREFLRRRA